MSAMVDFEFYSTVYMGTEADEASFPALCARAEDVIGAMTHWQVTAETLANYPALTQTLFKKAICAQVDYFGLNGLDSIAGGTDRGFTTGKVSMSGKNGNELVHKGAMAEYLSPQVIMYLEQTGLCNPQVPTLHEMPFAGWY
jgi:hypothetical protein